jgi:cysteine-S-conjugate beta-lyase
MAHHDGLNRRSFLTTAGMTAVASAVSGGAALAAASDSAAAEAAADASVNGPFDFDTPFNRIGTDCTRWDAQIRIYGKENIQAGMGIADMDFRAAPVITKALHERMQHENWGYLEWPPSFNEAVINWNKKRYGLTINPESLVITTGVHPGLIAAMQTFCPRGSKILINSPVYNGFFGDFRFTGITPEQNLLKLVDGRFSIDFEDFERRISPDTNAYLLCNPQNPTGNCWSPEDLMRLGEICLRRRVVVFADEIHCDFVTKGHKYTPFASLPNKAVVNNSITFKAASKSFGLAAMKTAWFFSDNMDYINRIKAHNRPDLTTLGMVANRAAYEGGEPWLNQLVDYIDGNHDYVESFIKSNIPMIKVAKAQGTYLAWLDVSGVARKINSTALAAEANKDRPSQPPLTPEQMIERHFVKTAKVQMSAGATFGEGGQNHMRMNIATSRKTLELALNNLARGLDT